MASRSLVWLVLLHYLVGCARFVSSQNAGAATAVPSAFDFGPMWDSGMGMCN